MNSKRLTALIVAGLVLGVALGYGVHVGASPEAATRFADAAVASRIGAG